MEEVFTITQRLQRWFAETFCRWYMQRKEAAFEALGRNKGYRDGQHDAYKRLAPDNLGYWPWQDGFVKHARNVSWGVTSDSTGVYLDHEGFRVAKFGRLDDALYVFGWGETPEETDARQNALIAAMDTPKEQA